IQNKLWNTIEGLSGDGFNELHRTRESDKCGRTNELIHTQTYEFELCEQLTDKQQYMILQQDISVEPWNV
ncbi:MAG: hypothetical protein JW735_06425, partial [Prolixibacteraceae bacterium]|nr:hypothetical protein [Prolixibacteraceae bacterium]